jgi:glycosyltransferase involved in cell wall biosynthesis
MANKKKILFISDHPLVPSGVGTQAKYLIEGLLKTGKYQFLCLGGAIKHPDYTPQKVDPEKYGDDWVIIPIDGYGDKATMRRLLFQERPDAIVIFTDPRFFTWLWEMEDEIHQICPLLYWHVWDNDPTPRFNKVLYDSTDAVVSLSLKTFGLLQDLKIESRYIPHAVDGEVFRPLSEDEIVAMRQEHLGPHADSKFIVFWNNRNARRKMTGDVLASFAKFKASVNSKVSLMMHTAVKDPEGQDITAVAKEFGIEKDLIISENRLKAEDLNKFYNMADCTINIANNEGFGLGTLESLYAGTPIVVHMTGGLQFQVGNWWEGRRDFSDQADMTRVASEKYRNRKGNMSKWWGVPVFSKVRSCTGSQSVPYIFDDRVDVNDVASALLDLYKLSRSDRRKLGNEASKWARQTFALNSMVSEWDDVIGKTLTKFSNRDSLVRVVRV